MQPWQPDNKSPGEEERQQRFSFYNEQRSLVISAGVNSRVGEKDSAVL